MDNFLLVFEDYLALAPIVCKYDKIHIFFDDFADDKIKQYVMKIFDGTIEKVENSMMDGTIVTLKINDNLRVVYKSLSESYVETGDKVKAGAKLRKVGTNVTEKAEGVHLHLEVKEKDKLVDPTIILHLVTNKRKRARQVLFFETNLVAILFNYFI